MCLNRPSTKRDAIANTANGPAIAAQVDWTEGDDKGQNEEDIEPIVALASATPIRMRLVEELREQERARKYKRLKVTEHLDNPAQLQLAKHDKQAQKSLLSVAKFLDGAYIPSEQDADVKYTGMFIILKEVVNTKNVGGRVKKKDYKSSQATVTILSNSIHDHKRCFDAMHLAREETTRDKYILYMIQRDESNEET